MRSETKMFHVKHAIASVAKICLHIFMTEHEHVGHEVSKHFCSELKFSITFLENNSQTPLPYKNHKIVVDNILINVEMLLRRELRKACLHAFHNRAAEFALTQKFKFFLLSFPPPSGNLPFVGIMVACFTWNLMSRESQNILVCSMTEAIMVGLWRSQRPNMSRANT